MDESGRSKLDRFIYYKRTGISVISAVIYPVAAGNDRYGA